MPRQHFPGSSCAVWARIPGDGMLLIASPPPLLTQGVAYIQMMTCLIMLTPSIVITPADNLLDCWPIQDSLATHVSCCCCRLGEKGPISLHDQTRPCMSPSCQREAGMTRRCHRPRERRAENQVSKPTISTTRTRLGGRYL